MDYIKRYVKRVGDYVSSVIDDPPTNLETENEKTKNSDIMPQVDAEEIADQDATSLTGFSSVGFLEWVPKLKTPTGENPLVYCINSLASFGSETEKPDTSHVLESKPVEDVVVVENVSLNPETTGEKQPDTVESDDAFSNWLNGLSLRTEEMWKQMKHDLTEVVNVMSAEPKDAVTRTASSLRQHISAAASAVGKMDPNRFTLLPESKPSESAEVDVGKPTQPSDPPPLSSDVPSLATLRSDVGQLMSGIMSSLFGTDEKDRAPVKSKREARLHVLRADPATYELEPPLPPAHLGVHTYSDWRAAYFDETTCQPLPGIPIAGPHEATLSDNLVNVDDLLEPAHPSPEELLEQYPFMRTYLSRLVTTDGQTDGKRLTDGDFWSRYYYRVWLLDVTEKRRQRLAERVEAIPRPHAGGVTDQHSQQSFLLPDDDWMADSDPETPTPAETAQSDIIHADSVITSPQMSADSESVASKGKRVLGKKSKRNGRKRNDTGRSPQLASEPEPTLSGQQQDSPTSVKPNSPPVDSQVVTPSVGVGGESDEAITSCSSSSVVVLSNVEDDPEVVTAYDEASVAPSLAATFVARPHPASNPSDGDSDDWGDVFEGEVKRLNEDQFSTQPSPNVEENKESSDWDVWS